jgi:hypothetical protein
VREDERDVVRECREGSFHVTSPPTPTPATTPTATATATATRTRGRPRATPGSQQTLRSVRVAARADDGDQEPPAQVGHNILANIPHVRRDTRHVQREVPDNPGEV